MSMFFPSYLMLVVTTSCNLSCSYCYEGEKHSGSAMSLETAMKALHMAVAPGKPFHVQITGGEPLLERERVFSILELIRREDWPVTVAIQTNGVLLDRVTIRKLCKYAVSIGLSVDGPPRLQEELRGGSAATYRAIKLLDEERVPFKVTTVLSDRNAGKLHLLAMTMHAFPMVSGIGLDLLVRKGGAAGKSCCGLPEGGLLRDGILKMLETIDLLNRERSRSLTLREKSLVLRAFRQGSRHHYCSASKGESLAVMPDGSLYPCTQTMDDPSCFLGTLDGRRDGEPAFRLSGMCAEGYWCSGCPLDGRCPGECPSRMMYNGSTRRNLMCVVYRTIFDYCIQKGEVAV